MDYTWKQISVPINLEGCGLSYAEIKDEHVHHLNGDRTDNRIENLAVLDAADHGREHFPPEKARRLSRLAQTARWGYIYAAI